MSEFEERPTRLLWLDLEMTGLNPREQRIIEVAGFVTDFAFEQSGEQFESLVHQPDEVLDNADDWVKENMPAQLEASRTSDRDEASVESDFAAFIEEHFQGEPAVLAGNSIHQDRKFIDEWWPEVARLLHYRMVDVSGLKVIHHGRTGEKFPKTEQHRALGDVEASVEELKWVLDRLAATDDEQ